MNFKRIAILAIAAIAAGVAAMLVRSMLPGRTVADTTTQPAVAMVEILVAAQDVSAGRVLDATSVRWQVWPEKAIMPNYISRKAQPDLTKAVAGTVARTPLISGQPLTEESIVRAGAVGFLAATVTPGMRAIGVAVTAETSAGGFILPNDRVDVVLTRDVSGVGVKNFQSTTILSDVRVLAVDQTSRQGKDQETVVGKTATLELTEDQAELCARAQQTGALSLTLRSIGDSSGMPSAKDFTPVPRPAGGRAAPVEQTPLVVYRYGVRRENGSSSSPPPAGGGDGSTPQSAPDPSSQQPTQGAVALETPR
jgi:pilus assembly protein CpaB